MILTVIDNLRDSVEEYNTMFGKMPSSIFIGEEAYYLKEQVIEVIKDLPEYRYGDITLVVLPEIKNENIYLGEAPLNARTAIINHIEETS